MRRAQDTGGLLVAAVATLFCLFLFVGPTHTQEFASLPDPYSECLASFDLGELANETVDDYHNYTESPRSRTILAILKSHFNSTSRQEIASTLNISVDCLDYLDFTLPEVALYLLNTTKFDQATFDDVFRGVFVSKIQKVLQTMHQVKLYLIFFNMQRNETLYELAETHNVTLNESTVLEVLFLPLDSDINSLSGFLEIGLSAFDLLDRTPVDLARLLGLEDPYIIKNYTFLQLMQLSLAGRDYLQNLQEIWSSLGVAWQQINKENKTTVVDVVLANVPDELHHLIPLATGIKEEELHLLNITLEDFAELVNMTAMDFSNYLVYPELIPFIINSMKDIGDIDEETEVEVTEAEKKIFLSYNVTIQDLIDLFNLTAVEIRILPPVKIEILCVRFTLIRYAKNLNLSLADVAVKVNKTEAELSYNLTVEEFYVVIRKLLVVRTFEIMSQMLGVSQDFLVNSLNIHAPIPSLTMCELNTFLNITRHSVLGLNEVVTQRTLAFVVQINGISIKRVYKLTIQQFITQILQLDLHYFFTLNGLQYSYSPSRVNILLQYKFFQLEKFFHFAGSFKKYKFVIFRHSLVWIINRIIYLNETDVDECLLGQHRCHPLSQCVNVPGSYECHCGGLTGYRDRFCRDINECRQDFAVCPPNLYCKNTPGSYECVCARGFYHNATTNNCEDINECASDTDNLCSYGGLNCVNTQGSYYCACPNGTRYDSRYKICRDINECREDRGLCLDIDENAECKNRRPGYECKCKRGFEPYYNESVSPRVLLNCTDIDECSTGQEICPLYSECINTIGGAYCRCLPGFRFKRGRCRAKRFVHVLLIWLRAITFKRYTRIDCPSGFPYFGKLHKKLYIYPNGMISIGKKYRRSEPKRLKDLNKDVIAVFWANTDVKNAYITYQVVDRSTPEFREQLDNTTVMLKNCSGLDEFNATWMLVVTWESVSPYARFFFRNPYLGEQSTYQVVLITNGTSSYVIYSYEDGGMDWNRRLQRKCAVGYATKGKKYYYQEADSFSEDIFNIDTKEFVNDINGVRTRGYFCKSLNADDEPIVLTNEQKCMNWYNEEPEPDSWMEELSDCPASRKAVRRDNRYRKVSSKNRKGRRGSKIYCYELRFPTRQYRASQQCCYFKGGKNKDAFVSEAPFAGRAYRYHYRNQRLRQISDIEPFSACCSEGESELCTLFYQKRPLTQAASATEFQLPCWCRLIAGGCRGRSCRPRRRPRRRFRRQRRAWFFGDPHISTLDGFPYTFNGLGDYVLLRSKDNFLHFHGRTERPLNTDGQLTNATVFSAFAFRTNDSDSGQIVFNDSVTGNLSITISGEMSCKTYTIEDFNEGLDFNGMSLERSTINNNTIVVSFPSGFSIEVTPGIQLLQLSVSAPDDLMNNTQGLLGTFNGIDTDDLEYPNGTVIPRDSTEEEIFHLGQEWKVPYEERLFVSSSCMLQNVSFDDSFVPYFLNMSAVSEKIKALCKGNRECMFDVLTTGNEEIGKQTVGFEEDNQAAINELDNTPPEITGPAEINVTLNQKTQFYITASDPDNDTITLEIDDLPDGAMFNTSSGHFDWTPVNASNITLEFVATDSKNDSSILPVIVNMCRCENGGECDFTEFVGDNTGVFRVVGCNCTDGYEGDFCEVEVLDACADEPCYDNVTCNSTKNPFGFQCGPCPAGLTGDGENCYEIDECENDNGGCNQTCVNTFGSFYCECKQGYTTKDEGRICEEINECQDANAQHNCTENAICTNLPGSFKCTCKPGFEGDPTSNCTDIDECNNGDALCSQGCRNTPGSFECTCQDGFQLAANKETCEDINECTKKTHDCEQDDYCHNLVSSYECRCPPGLALNPDKKTCRVAEGSECDSSNGGCSDICVNRTGLITCYCNAGFSLNDDEKTCADINECLTGNPGCSHSCSNNDGSFKCTCPSGYALAVDGKTCDDVNECENPEHHNCSQVCENTEGSFVCSCEDGFVLQQDNTSCADVDECEQKDLCKDGVCINNPGSYQCACPAPRVYIRDKCRGLRKFAMGLKLGRLNGKSVVWDPALSNTKSAAFGILAKKVEKQTDSYFRSKNTKGFLGSRCRKFRQGSVVAEVDLNFAENATDVTTDTLTNELPNSGEMGNMTYDPQSAQVKDFDECASDETNNCHKYATCTNTAGSFKCKCKDGYQGDGITCTDEPKPADSDDKDKKKRVAIIIGAVFGGLVLLIIIVVCWSKRQKRYKAEIEEPNHSFHLTSRSVQSDVRFRGDEKEKETRSGSYDVNPAPMYGNLDSGSRMSGDYEYPDPQPVGTKNTFYDNPGLQQETAQ